MALHFSRRYTLSSWIALTSVITLLVFKIVVIGWKCRLTLKVIGPADRRKGRNSATDRCA